MDRGSDNALAFVTKLGEDGNALGGVRLPHVRTTLPCGISGDPNIYDMAGGIFTPCAQVDLRLCSAFYPTNQSYRDAITEAAKHDVVQGWILAEEIDSIVAAAEKMNWASWPVTTASHRRT